MSSACRISKFLSPGAFSTPIRPRAIFRAIPPSCRCRTFLSRRRTSFWAPSYPESNPHTSTLQVPFTPPPPTDNDSGRLPEETGPGAIVAEPRDKKNRYLNSLMEKAGELSLKCSILDAEGNWGAEGQKYTKLELCREYDLDPRDLRKLDSLSPSLVPVILTRKTCILISMLHFRALIKPDSVIVFDSSHAHKDVTRRFKYHLQKNIKAGLGIKDGEADEEKCDEIVLSYEHRALESILVVTANALEEEMAFSRHIVQQLLADLEDHIDRENLRKLLHYSKRIAAFQSRARYVKSAIDELLDSDEDLSAMYLTSRAQGRPRALHDHEQLELLLESFVKQVEEIVSEVDTTVVNMQSTQEIAELMLDSGRNALLALDIKISIATLGIGSGALLAGLFGMNLSTQLEETPYAFAVISSTAFLVTLIITAYGLRTLRRVRRVALSGRNPTVLSSVLGSASWDSSVAQFSQGFDPALVDMRTEMAKRAIWETLWWGSKRKELDEGEKWRKPYTYASTRKEQNKRKWGGVPGGKTS
ncbi:magnesium transporter [Cryptococcus gattii E566]|nr:magnesium transporter [Cryptococcus gattii E566]